MSEADTAGEIIEREEVAPELVMEMIRTHEPDGRYLIYYNFQTPARDGGAAAGGADPNAALTRPPGDR